jgi:hypothetical protein
MNFDIAFYDFNVVRKAPDLYFIYSKHYIDFKRKPIKLEVRIDHEITIALGIVEDTKHLILSSKMKTYPNITKFSLDLDPNELRKELKHLARFKLYYFNFI